jgi:hypothetical protein
LRDEFRSRFSFAIPDCKTIGRLSYFGPLLEVSAFARDVGGHPLARALDAHRAFGRYCGKMKRNHETKSTSPALLVCEISACPGFSTWGIHPDPLVPQQAHPSLPLNGQGCASPLSEGGAAQSKGGFVSSPARHSSGSENSIAAFPGIPRRDISGARCKVDPPAAPSASGLTAFSFEFVAKPEQAAGAPLFLPAAIQSGLEDIAGFAGSLVMVSDQEARLITVIIFWNGTEARRGCERSMRRVRALLAPYMDRCLRAQNLLAHFSTQQVSFSQGSPIDNCFIDDESVAQEANICAA